MAAYPNTLGIIVANGVINDVPSTNAASVIRAVARDVKKYMAIAAGISGQRVLPLGVSASSVRHVLMPQFAYMTGGPQDDAIDFFSVGSLDIIRQHTQLLTTGVSLTTTHGVAKLQCGSLGMRTL